MSINEFVGLYSGRTAHFRIRNRGALHYRAEQLSRTLSFMGLTPESVDKLLVKPYRFLIAREHRDAGRDVGQLSPESIRTEAQERTIRLAE